MGDVDLKELFNIKFEGLENTIKAEMGAIRDENERQSTDIQRIGSAVENFAPRCDERHGDLTKRTIALEHIVREHDQSRKRMVVGVWVLATTAIGGFLGGIAGWFR